jgi:hypothetical protein
LTGSTPSLAPVFCSLAEAALLGTQGGAYGLLIQGFPWGNALYPTCLQDLSFFVGAGMAWSRQSTAALLGIDNRLGGDDSAFSEDGLDKDSFSALVQLHLYPGSPNDVEVLLGATSCGFKDVRRQWTTRHLERPLAEACDQALWQLHVLGDTISPLLAPDLHSTETTCSFGAAQAAISESYKYHLKLLRDFKWTRQEGVYIYF